MEAIDTAGSEVEVWGDDFSEELLWGPLPEATPQMPLGSDQRGQETPKSEEEDFQQLLEAAEQLLSGRETPEGPSPSLGDPAKAAEKLSVFAQTPSEQRLQEEQQEQVDDEVGLLVTC